MDNFLFPDDIEQYWAARIAALDARGYAIVPQHPSGGGISSLENAIGVPSETTWSLPTRPNVVVATHKKDGKLVYIKRSFPDNNEVSCEELTNVSQLHDDTGRFEAANHCVPVLEVFPDDLDGTYVFVVMPFLPDVNLESLKTIQDVIDFVGQILLGLHYMHRRHIGHRDCTIENIVMDPSPADQPSSSQKSPRIRYYIFDFTVSAYLYLPPYGKPGYYESFTRGGYVRDWNSSRRSWDPDEAFDPYTRDVNTVGNMLKYDIYLKYSNVQFLEPLIANMTRPENRCNATATECLADWCTILPSISSYARRQRLRPVDEHWTRSALLDLARLGASIRGSIFWLVSAASGRQSNPIRSI